MAEIIEQTRLLSKKEVEQIRKKFGKQGDIVKGSCFAELLDNIDRHRN